MKKYLKITLGFAALAFFLAIGAFLPIKAATYLEADVEHYYDLDGDGKDEKILYSLIYGEEGYYSVDLEIYINDSLFMCSPDEYYNDISITLTDINPADKYKELEVEFVEDGDYCTYNVYRYKKNKLSLLFSTDYFLLPEQKNGNKVLVHDYVISALGNTTCITLNCKIKNKKLVEVAPKSLTYKVQNGSDTWYTAAKKINVYKKADGKKVVKTIKAGTEFKVTNLKIIDGEVVYAQIVLKGKKKSLGWINVEYYEGCSWEDKLVENPLFAG